MQPRRSILPPMPQLRSSHAPGWVAVARGTAAGLALLLIGGLAEQRQWGTSLVDGWLFSLAPLPETAALALVAFTAPLLLLFFAFPGLPQPLRLICFLTVLACCGFIGREVWQATEQTSEQIRTAALAQPLGLLLLFVVTGLGVVGCGSPRVRGRSSWFAMLLAACLTVCSFPVLSIQTAAVRPVAVDFNPRLIVVPLCPNTETGELSESLLDRLQTAAAELRRSRRARLLLCGLQQSGRLPAEGQLQAAAAQLGIAAERLQIDLSGLSLPDLLLQTAVPANSSTAQPTQVLLVSHWYELSRLRLLARRAGVQPATAAARQQHALFRQNQLIAGETLLMLRELASPVIAFARQSRIASETILDTETAPSDLSGPSDPATPGTDPAVNPADPFRQL